MSHWRDGGIGNMAGSDDRPVEEWTLLERLAAVSAGGNLPAIVVRQSAQEAFDEIDRLRARLKSAELVKELRHRVMFGGGVGHIYGDELEQLIRAIQSPKPGFEPSNGGAS